MMKMMMKRPAPPHKRLQRSRSGDVSFLSRIPGFHHGQMQEGEGRWKERREVDTEREGGREGGRGDGARGQLTQGTRREARIPRAAPPDSTLSCRRRKGDGGGGQRHKDRHNHASVGRRSHRRPGCLACVRGSGTGNTENKEKKKKNKKKKKKKRRGRQPAISCHDSEQEEGGDSLKSWTR
ncbi:hypothetical protein EYF80_003739 [Liparis tanakae]|uniref:Uncharacterized protein n=1 Tax=Liparis tanakae TaxID=230148 RepID=A0A4Z2J681_9TELE|nr:hypothetical protein EYF80_003739 [Liparis tanakae]